MNVEMWKFDNVDMFEVGSGKSGDRIRKADSPLGLGVKLRVTSCGLQPY
jgi:hypothetical protein